jgi:hypothetical protein
MVAGAVLNPEEGMAHIRQVLRDPNVGFPQRYRALRAITFLHDSRPGRFKKKDLVDAVCLTLDHGDMADLTIEYLRKWKCWDRADKVLTVLADNRVIKRAVLRYCLQCEGNAQAAAHVAAQRKADAELVRDTHELLDLEKPAEGGKP